MSLLGKKLINPAPVLESTQESEVHEDNIIKADLDYCMENYGDITFEEEIYMDQLTLMESFHEMDCIENAYYADKIAMESASLSEEELSEREVLFEADQEGAKTKAIDKLIGMVKRVAEKVKGVYHSLINYIGSLFSNVDKFISNYDALIRGGSCKMECYEYNEVTPELSWLKNLNTNRISQSLNTTIGGQVNDILGRDKTERAKAAERLNNLKKQLAKFDKQEILDFLRGKKEVRELKGVDVLTVLKDKKLIGDMKKQVTYFERASKDVLDGFLRTKQRFEHEEKFPETIQFMNAYATAFNAQAQSSLKTAKCVIEVAQERVRVYLKAAKKIVNEQATEGSMNSKIDDFNEMQKKMNETLNNLYNQANNRPGMDL